MKELSIEEKAKRYDKAIEKINSKWHYKNQSCFIDVTEIFPELKESEDESIRKWIRKELESKYVVDNIVNNVMADKALAWLEKQGEKDKLIKELGKYKAKYTQEVLEKYINSIGNKDDERLRKTTISFLKDFADKGYENAVECIDWLKAQGLQNLANSAKTCKDEQKPTDNIKPKFKVGDKIVFVGKANTISPRIGNVYEIIDVLEKGYECKHDFYIPFTEQNNYRNLNGVEFKQKYFILTWEQCKKIYDEHKDEIYQVNDGELFAVPCELYFLNHI